MHIDLGASRRLMPGLLRTLAHSAPAGWLKGVPGMPKVYSLLKDLAWVGTTQIVWDIEGSKMYLNPWDTSPLRRTFRGYISAPKEPMTVRLFKEVVRPGDTVLDVGANIGFFSLLAARLVGKTGRVYAFEPEPRNFQLLAKNVALNGYDQVVAYQKAVWRHPARLKLYLSNVLDTGAHTLRATHESRYFDHDHGGKAVEVDCVVLDSFLAATHPVNVIKMDIEGAEAGALEGMAEIIRDNPDLKLFVEFYPDAIREMGDSPEAFVRTLLEDYGFAALVIDELDFRPTSQARTFPIGGVDDLLSLCQHAGTIVNLLLTRRGRDADR